MSVIYIFLSRCARHLVENKDEKSHHCESCCIQCIMDGKYCLHMLLIDLAVLNRSSVSVKFLITMLLTPLSPLSSARCTSHPKFHPNVGELLKGMVWIPKQCWRLRCFPCRLCPGRVDQKKKISPNSCVPVVMIKGGNIQVLAMQPSSPVRNFVLPIHAMLHAARILSSAEHLMQGHH